MIRAVCLGVLLLLARPLAAAEAVLDLLDPATPYTAAFTVHSDKGDFSGIVRHAKGRERRDWATKDGGQALYLNRAEDAAVLLKPTGKWYVGLSLSAVARLAGGLDSLTVQRAKLGEDATAGVRATHYRITAQSFEGEAWFSKEGIPLRIQGTLTAPDGRAQWVETELSDVRIGVVDQSWLGIPPGFFGMDLRKVPPEQLEQAITTLRPLLERK